MSNSYFQRVPNFLYPSLLNDKTSSLETVTAKNLFRRVKIREDIFESLVALEQYRIKGYERPDQVAHLFYGDPRLDWLVLAVNNAIDKTFSWPMTDDQFYNFLITKYGSEEKLNEIKFYFTKEIKDFDGNVMLESGIAVDEDFTFQFFDKTLETQVTVSGSAARTSMTNYEYEIDLNEQKRDIYILRREYLDQAIRDSVTELRYKKSSEYIDNTLKKTENIRITSPNR
jgi:hypothetical protein